MKNRWLPTKRIEKACVHSPGDRSVGIPDCCWELEMDFDPSYYEPQDVSHALESIRQALVDAYEMMCGEKCYVEFDFEAEAQAKEEDVYMEAEMRKLEKEEQA